MSRTPARFTQADIARVIRAARQTGAATVEVRPDGSILVHLCSGIEAIRGIDTYKGLELHKEPIL
jgi:hypothetical protein